jgi:hypothetical protein
MESVDLLHTALMSYRDLPEHNTDSEAQGACLLVG